MTAVMDKADRDPNYRQSLHDNEEGVRLDDAGRSEEALEYFDRSLALDPNADEVWDNKGLAEALDGLGKYKEALTYYERAYSLCKAPNIQELLMAARAKVK